jgi:hypothetical protein
MTTPVVAKPTLSNQGAGMAVSDLTAMSWYRNQAGGSTGEPLQLLQTQRYFKRGMAQIERDFT